MAIPCPCHSITGGIHPQQIHINLPGMGKKAAGARPPPTPKSQTLPPLSPPQPPAPHCLTCPPQHEGDFAKRRWCLLVHPNGCPHLATAAASAPPSPGFLSCLWVWSKLDALKKLFMCVRVCVRVCVNHMIVIHLYPEQRLCTV